MNQITKPMLAGKCEDISKLKFPILATPKLDGIRCLALDHKALSRSFKLIPNRYIQKLVSKLPEGLDGELMLNPTYPGDKTDPLNQLPKYATFQQVTSAVMSEDGEPDFVYNAFDYVSNSSQEQYDARMVHLKALDLPVYVNKILPVRIPSAHELEGYEAACLMSGYEGVMIRDPYGPYKCGRSTEKEGFLLKLKRFADSEARVIGFVERLHNGNEATKDELGHTKRSSHKANLVRTDTLGALAVQDVKTEVAFEIGTGFDDAMRKEIWTHPAKYKNQIVKYKYQEMGMKDKPRCPVFLGFRDERDL